MSCTPFVICSSLLGNTAFTMGNAMSFVFALYDRALKSLGRQDPPNANPGIRYAGDILSFLSWQKMPIISCASIESDLHKLPISFAKPIFKACQQLSTYLTISAVSTLVR